MWYNLQDSFSGGKTHLNTLKQTDSKFDSPEYKRSRTAYSAQCAFEYFIALLVSDAYLAKLLSVIGLSDGLIGIISSFITVSFLFQLTSIILVRRMTNTKRTATIFNTVSSLLFAALYLIPFIPVPKTLKTIMVMVCILAAYFCNYSVTSIIYKWGNSFVDPSKRGDFSAGKEMASLISGMCFTLAVGHIVTSFEKAGNLSGGFLFIASAGLIVSFCNFGCLLLIAPKESEKSSSPAFRDVLKKTFGNRNFVNVVFMYCLWEFGKGMTIGFLGIYKTKDLMMTVGTVQVINTIGNACRFFMSKPIGRFSDKKSFVKGIELALGIAAVGFAFNVFASPAAKWCIVVYTILYAVSSAGTVQNFNNIIYSYVDAEYFVQASAIKSSIGGVIGFSASLVGSAILGAVNGAGNQILGITVYGQQVLSAISVLFIIGAILFAHFVIEKQSVMKQ